MSWSQVRHPDGRVTTTTTLYCRSCHAEQIFTAGPDESLSDQIIEFINFGSVCTKCKLKERSHEQ